MKLQRTLNPALLPLLFAPALNVALVFVFFFLLGGAYLLQPGVAVKVPDSPFLLAPQRDPQVVAITGPPTPAIYFENKRMTPADLRAALKSRPGATRTLIIKSDRRAPVETFVEVVNVAIESGCQVVLATSQEPQ